MCRFADETDAATIRGLALADVVEVYDALVRPSSGVQTRRKLSVHLVSQQMAETPEEPAGAQMIVDESRFKAGLGCAPAATPIMSEAFGEYQYVCM